MLTGRIPLYTKALGPSRQNMPRQTRIVRDEKGLVMTLSEADSLTWYAMDCEAASFRSALRTKAHIHGVPWMIVDHEGFPVDEGDHFGGLGSSEE
jgi:hypothetical protein